MSDDERKALTFEEAIAMLPSGDMIHTFVQVGPVLVGADWARERIYEAIRKYGIELAGRAATGSGHGLVIIREGEFDKLGIPAAPVFIATK